MTVEQTQSTMDDYFEALLGGRHYETFFADDIVVTLVGTVQEIKGPAVGKDAIDALHHGQFDAEFIGTHTAEFAGIPSTGKKVEVPYSVFYELKDDKITALRIYGLVDGLIHQLESRS